MFAVISTLNDLKSKKQTNRSNFKRKLKERTLYMKKWVKFEVNRTYICTYGLNRHVPLLNSN